MSQNNQILIKQYKGKWYVINNVTAESWSGTNTIYLDEKSGCFETKEEALKFAHKLDEKIWDIGLPNSEYGVRFDTLAKDGAEVNIRENRGK